jgi:hypothetical protein
MNTAHTAYFGDAEYQFKLSFAMVKELEGKTGLPAAVLFARIFNRQFAITDLHELIRCALIGGGTAPKRAAELVATYAVDRPLAEIYPLAERIAEIAWLGSPNEN